MTSEQALEFIARHGIVLESARGPVPSLAEGIAGEPIRGSWWGHPKAHTIHRITKVVRDSPQVLVCRLVDGKVTFVHRRLWPAVVAIAERVPSNRLVKIREIHTTKGHHEVSEIPYPEWVSAEVAEEARTLGENSAVTTLGNLAEVIAAE